jgi:LemA protein
VALPYLAERYPDLKAAPAFARLHDELVDTEDRIAFAREFFNATVTALNNRRETMPDALVAKLTGLRRGEYFAAERFERAWCA